LTAVPRLVQACDRNALALPFPLATLDRFKGLGMLPGVLYDAALKTVTDLLS
jgi:hypothetical protein